MSQKDVLIEILKAEWSWAIPEPVKILKRNAFGNLIVVDNLGHIFRVIPEDLTAQKIGDKLGDIDKYFKNKDNMKNWEMERLVTVAEERYGKLTENECYGFKIWPVLGASYEEENMVKKNVQEWLRASGNVGRQVKDLPNGAKIKFDFNE